MAHVEPSWHEAREIAYGCVDLLPTEIVRLVDAHGLVAAEDVKALTPLPPSAVSAMDGWAVAGSGPWVIVGDALAGSPLAQPLTPGTAARIATGAVVPTDQIAHEAEARLADARVAYVHVRSARNNCYQVRIDRA